MAAQIEGSVLLEAVVSADGSTGDVRVVKSLDSRVPAGSAGGRCDQALDVEAGDARRSNRREWP